MDTTPNSAQGKDDSAVSIGRTFSDTTANVHITPTAKGGTGADQWLDVNVQIGAFPGNLAPTATLTAAPTAVARNSASFSVVALDANADTLAYFWDFGDGTLSSNASSATHQWAKGGTYTVSVTVSDMKGGTVTRNQSVTVTDPLDTWTTRTSGTTADLSDIAEGGGSLVAVGYDGPNFKGMYSKSIDGITWTSGTIKINTIPAAIIHDGTRFIMVGEEYDFTVPAGWRGAIFTSTDGIAWTRRHFSGVGLKGVAAGGGVYVAVGKDGRALRSTDSVAWTPVTSGVTHELKDVTWGGGRFVAGGGDMANSPYPTAVLTSADGTTWTNTTSGAGLPSIGDLAEIEYLDGRFIGGGWNAGIRESTDLGSTFTATESSFRTMTGIAQGNGTYLAVGAEPGIGGADLNLVSTDGKSWTSITTASQSDRNDLIFFNNTFITVGAGGTIRQSTSVPADLAGFAAWVQLQFPGSPALSGPDEDFDGDGVKNLVEYA
ncbi:MAG: PKD domain-containing protein, partial [Verrucomicrobiaceae bacterium]